MHQYVQKSLETFFAPKLSRTTTITNKKNTNLFSSVEKCFFSPQNTYLRKVQQKLFNLHCLTWTLFMIFIDYIYLYIFIYTNIHLYLYLFWKAKQKCWKKKPLSMVEISRSQFAYRNLRLRNKKYKLPQQTYYYKIN